MQLRVDKNNSEYFTCQCGLKVFGVNPRGILYFSFISNIIKTPWFRKNLVEHVRINFAEHTRWLSYDEVMDLEKDEVELSEPIENILPKETL